MAGDPGWGIGPDGDLVGPGSTDSPSDSTLAEGSASAMGLPAPIGGGIPYFPQRLFDKRRRVKLPFVVQAHPKGIPHA